MNKGEECLRDDPDWVKRGRGLKKAGEEVNPKGRGRRELPKCFMKISVPTEN